MHEALINTGIIILLSGTILGFLLHRSDYCMSGMFRDIFLFRDSPLLRIFFLQVIVTMFLFYLCRKIGLLSLYPPPNLREASFVTLLGGFIFGIGMVLAGGCVIGTLYKMGSGNMASLLAFLGLIIGSGLYAEVYPVFNKIHRDTLLGMPVLLSEARLPFRGLRSEDLLFLMTITSGIFIIRGWIKRDLLYQKAYAEGYIQPYRTAIYISFVNLILYIAAGTPMAISTAYAKIAAWIEKSFIPRYYESLEFFRRVSYSTVTPDGEVIEGGPGAVIDHIFIAEMPLLAGVVLGSFLSSISLGEFRLFKKMPPWPQVISAFVGGMLLALSSRMAGGCNVKFLMSGLPLFSSQAFLFLLGLLPGTYLGTIIFKKWVLGGGGDE